MHDYKVVRENGDVAYIRKDDNTCIPPDPRNADYREYLAAVARGDTPDVGA